jgi:cyclase
MIQVTPNVYVESGLQFCNLGLVTTKEGVVMIDTPFNPSDAVKWRDEVSKRGKPHYLINTEEHPDHCQSSWFFPGVLITSQETRNTLSKVSAAEVRERIKRTDPEGLPLMESFQVRLADITFTGSLDLYLGDHTFSLFQLLGHSPGGIGVYIPQERIVFTTDCVFHKFKTWLQEANPDQWLESLRKLSELDVDTIVPGHGGICKKDYLKEQADIIRQWVEIVQSAIKQGLSEDEAVAKISPPDPYPKQPHTPMGTARDLDKMIIAHLYRLYYK